MRGGLIHWVVTTGKDKRKYDNIRYKMIHYESKHRGKIGNIRIMTGVNKADIVHITLERENNIQILTDSTGKLLLVLTSLL